MGSRSNRDSLLASKLLIASRLSRLIALVLILENSLHYEFHTETKSYQVRTYQLGLNESITAWLNSFLKIVAGIIVVDRLS